ncbi:hypothetical protein GW17_00040246 [Ensete ventricosum]|nr:hypothetical protein GW17_00040246 [Ensete ventricosum]
MNRADKSAGLHFVSTLIDRVHDVGRLVRSQHEKILVLRAANKELKSQAGQDLAVATELHMKELEEDVDKLQVELGPRVQSGGRLQGVSRVRVRPREDGEVNYKFGYRVALERLWGKHLEIVIEHDPFDECPDDAKVEMDLNQPFDDSTPSKK